MNTLHYKGVERDCIYAGKCVVSTNMTMNIDKVVILETPDIPEIHVHVIFVHAYKVHVHVHVHLYRFMHSYQGQTDCSAGSPHWNS